MTIAYDAMMLARELHKDQVRKYTGNPYSEHLAEVAGIVSAVQDTGWSGVRRDEIIAVAWLHDSIEDQGLTHNQLLFEFGKNIADGVLWLSDMEEGNRATRKQLSCKRLSSAPGWVQTIKCADLISNTSSIVKHDPEFAKVYLKEKRDLLDAMENADPRLWSLADSLCRVD